MWTLSRRSFFRGRQLHFTRPDGRPNHQPAHRCRHQAQQRPKYCVTLANRDAVLTQKLRQATEALSTDLQRWLQHTPRLQPAMKSCRCADHVTLNPILNPQTCSEKQGHFSRHWAQNSRGPRRLKWPAWCALRTGRGSSLLAIWRLWGKGCAYPTHL